MISFISLILLLSYSDATFHLNDDILYGINWYEQPIEHNDSKSILIKTASQEKYNCLIPHKFKPKQSEHSVDNYDGPTEFELINRLFVDKICSTKESPYWIYEVCHGKHVRQYHTALETSGKPSTVQQYFLGYNQILDQTKENKQRNEKKKIPRMTLNSVNLPYFPVNMSDGDFCELINRPRSVQILYFCFENTLANLYDFQEISSCEYRAIIFTKHLCEHPSYKMQDNHINQISCYPMDGSPVVPNSLTKIREEIKNTENIISSVDSIVDNGKTEPQIKVEAYRKNGIIYYRIITLEKTETNENKDENSNVPQESVPSGRDSVVDESLDSDKNPHNIKPKFAESNHVMERFLSAKYCIESGANYWRHRVCFLKKISQYHMEVDLETQEIVMGFWNEVNHLKWIKENPEMKPTSPAESRMDLYHHYSDGSFCDEIKENRRTILKISCINDNSSSVTVIVSEPTICNYVVSVKGSVFCPLVKEADENGLIKPK